MAVMELAPTGKGEPTIALKHQCRFLQIALARSTPINAHLPLFFMSRYAFRMIPEWKSFVPDLTGFMPTDADKHAAKGKDVAADAQADGYDEYAYEDTPE